MVSTAAHCSVGRTIEFDDSEYFAYPAIFRLMADTLKKSDPGVFAHCAGAIDTLPARTLRGLAYLGELLSQDSDGPEKQKSIARETISEVTALIAALIEMQSENETMYFCDGLGVKQ